MRWLRGHPVLQAEGLLLVTILISIGCGGAAVALHRAIHLLTHLLHAVWGTMHGGWHPLMIVITPAAGGLVAGLLLYYLVPAARGSGIPQVKLDLAMRRGEIPFKVALGKFITTTVAVGSGGSVGREGPTVQICASIGSTIARWFPLTTAQVRIIVHAASVAGLAAAFNTPSAGLTFVMEEVIGDLNARHLSYLLVAAVGATIMERLPLMLANMTSLVLARWFEPHNVYEAILAANHIYLPSPQDHLLLEDITAAAVMERHPHVVQPETSVAQVAALLEQSHHRGFPVVTPAHSLLGIVTITDVRQALAKGSQDDPVSSIATTANLVVVHPDHTLNWVMQQLGEHEVSLMPVVTRNHPPRLVGTLTRADAIRAFARKKAQ
jgi:CBS domain-containing protein